MTLHLEPHRLLGVPEGPPGQAAEAWQHVSRGRGARSATLCLCPGTQPSPAARLHLESRGLPGWKSGCSGVQAEFQLLLYIVTLPVLFWTQGVRSLWLLLSGTFWHAELGCTGQLLARLSEGGEFSPGALTCAITVEGTSFKKSSLLDS